MSLGEFDVIERFFLNANNKKNNGVGVGIGDDAAVVDVPPHQQLVTSVDTLVEGVHFPVNTAPEVIAQRSVTANLSDIAAMGAEPKWCLLSLSLPNIDEAWLEPFSQRLSSMLCHYGVSLVGGDTVRAAELSVTITIMGVVSRGKAILRSGAKDGDDIYVSGFLGEAAMGLENYLSAPNLNQRVQQCFLLPVPRLQLGLELRGIANSCIDISDGLLADAEHIARSSKCQMTIYLEQIFISQAMKALVKQPVLQREYALTGGDDYELCFTAPVAQRKKVQVLSDKFKFPIARIGKVSVNSRQPVHVVCVDEHGETVSFEKKGYQHFLV